VDSDLDKLSNFFPGDYLSLTNLYRGSDSGFKASTVHELVDYQGPIIFFVRSTTGKVFGGYAE